MDVLSAVSAIEQKASEVIHQEEGDYIGEDGLLYCGKCNTPKQTEVNLMGVIKRPLCLCRCASEKYKADAAERKKQQLLSATERLRDAGFPDGEMKNWTFEADDRKNDKISQLARNYVSNFKEFYKDGKGLLLFGSVGTGKTFIAACIANALIDRGYPCLVTNFARLVNSINDAYKRQEFIDGLDRYALLVIDDLATERDTGYMNEVVQSVIDARYRIKRPLIVTTNLDAAELKNPKEQTKMRVYSRLYEMCLPVEVTGTDRRRGKLWESTRKYSDILGLKGE